MEDIIIKVGLIGLGGMADHHLRLLSQLENVEISALCDVNEAVVHARGEEYRVPQERRFSNYESLIGHPEVDAVISIVPNKFHAEIIRLCIQYQKPIMTEKPFTLTFKEAEELKKLYEQQPIPCMVGFSYRYIPAFRYVKQLLEENKLGTIRHLSVQYLQQWGSPIFNVPFSWRFSKEMSGSGALGDLGSHMIDTARYFTGEFQSIFSMMKTFVNERAASNGAAMKSINVDDFTSFQATLENGVIGTFVTSRNAIGSGNQLEVTIFGDYGTVHVCCERPDEVTICLKDKDRDTPFRTELVPDEYKRNQLQDFIDIVLHKNPKDVPTFYDGYQNQKILEKIIQSAESQKLEFL